VLGLNNLEHPALGAVRRPMSIASPPEVEGPIEFYIRRIARPETQNPLTPLLWTLKAGDRLYLRPVAAGHFTIRNTIGVCDRRLRVCVAAGTGVAPFISMIRSEVLRDRGADLSRWVLLHGVSYPADLGYRQELMNLSASNRLHYWGTVSRPVEPSRWSGDTGRVEGFFEPARLCDLERRLALPSGAFSPDKVAVFVCGLTGTITGTMIRLIDRGFIPDGRLLRDALGAPPEAATSLFFERYDPEPVMPLDDERIIEPLRLRMQAALTRRAAG
jgi:ferredoxin--NADP+ reductase